MIRDFQFYHGTAIAKIIHSGELITIRLYKNDGNASYVINEKVGLYLKHSSKRMSPWSFSFHKEHQKEILELKQKFGNVVVGLICNDDGIVGLNYDELKFMLDEDFEEVEWIRISRKPRHEYSVSGKDGKLRHKIITDDFVHKVLV